MSTHRDLDFSRWMLVTESLFNRATFLYVKVFKPKAKNAQLEQLLFRIRTRPEFLRLDKEISAVYKTHHTNVNSYICFKILLCILNGFLHFPTITKPFSVFGSRSFAMFDELVGAVIPNVKAIAKDDPEIQGALELLMAAVEYDKGELKKSIEHFDNSIQLLKTAMETNKNRKILANSRASDNPFLKLWLGLEFEFSSGEKLSKIITLKTIIQRILLTSEIKREDERVMFSTRAKAKILRDLSEEALQYDSDNAFAHMMLGHHYGDNMMFEESEKAYNKVLRSCTKFSIVECITYFFLATRRFVRVQSGGGSYQADYVLEMDDFLKKGLTLLIFLEKNSVGITKSLGLLKEVKEMSKNVTPMIRGLTENARNPGKGVKEFNKTRKELVKSVIDSENFFNPEGKKGRDLVDCIFWLSYVASHGTILNDNTLEIEFGDHQMLCEKFIYTMGKMDFWTPGEKIKIDECQTFVRDIKYHLNLEFEHELRKAQDPDYHFKVFTGRIITHAYIPYFVVISSDYYNKWVHWVKGMTAWEEKMSLYNNIYKFQLRKYDELKKLCVCYVCGRRDKVMLCSRCHTIGYCTREHQLADWKRHKKDCKRKK